jgi:Amiloride-sensitive sodium channel
MLIFLSRNYKKLSKYFVRFKEQQVNILKKMAQYTTVDFVAFVGGLFGLFAGFSALSL